MLTEKKELKDKKKSHQEMKFVHDRQFIRFEENFYFKFNF